MGVIMVSLGLLGGLIPFIGLVLPAVGAGLWVWGEKTPRQAAAKQGVFAGLLVEFGVVGLILIKLAAAATTDVAAGWFLLMVLGDILYGAGCGALTGALFAKFRDRPQEVTGSPSMVEQKSAPRPQAVLEKTQPAQPSNVVFVREDRKSVMPGITRIYRIHRAPDAAAAVAFLAQNAIMRMHEYIIVETPEGNFGRDISGMFDESTGSTIPAKYFQGIKHGTLSFFAASGLPGGLYLGTQATAYALGPGGRTGATYSADFLPVSPSGDVIAAIIPLLPVGEYEVQTNFTAPMKATVRAGQVAELNKSL
jgi:hypothetical protein